MNEMCIHTYRCDKCVYGTLLLLRSVGHYIIEGAAVQKLLQLCELVVLVDMLSVANGAHVRLRLSILSESACESDLFVKHFREFLVSDSFYRLWVSFFQSFQDTLAQYLKIFD